MNFLTGIGSSNLYLWPVCACFVQDPLSCRCRNRAIKLYKSSRIYTDSAAQKNNII